MLMDEKCMIYSRTFFYIVFLEICKSFELFPKSLVFEIKYGEVDVDWLLKFKIHLDKLEKIKQKQIREISANSLIKKMVLERFYEHLAFFKFKYDLIYFVVLSFTLS